jgi:hypothetical protein
MSENSLPTTLPTRQAAAIEGRSKRLAVTGKLKAALEAMIWEGLPRAEAAAKAGMVDSSLRFALRKPHVLAHYNGELAALRTSLRARNVHRLDGIASTSTNDMAKVAAIKTMEGLADASAHLNSVDQPRIPGVQIVIVQRSTTPPPMIEATSARIAPAQAE